MTQPFTRNLIFRTDQTINTAVTLMLTFDKIIGVPSMDQVAWRVIQFGGPNQSAPADYVQNLMIASVSITDGNVVTASANTAISIGQETTLKPSGKSGAVIFTPPVSGISGELVATNSTGQFQGLAVGYLDSANIPNPLLVWQNVGDQNSIEATYTPVLSAYVTSDYEETQLITGQIASPVLLNQNLALLTSTQTTYTLSMGPDGSYSLNQDQAAVAPLRSRVKFDPRSKDYLPGKSDAISVKNNLSSVIHVSVATTSGGSAEFCQVAPGQTEFWGRKGPEVISVNVGGVGRVAHFYGIVGKTLLINAS